MFEQSKNIYTSDSFWRVCLTAYFLTLMMLSEKITDNSNNCRIHYDDLCRMAYHLNENEERKIS